MFVSFVFVLLSVVVVVLSVVVVQKRRTRGAAGNRAAAWLAEESRRAPRLSPGVLGLDVVGARAHGDEVAPCGVECFGDAGPIRRGEL
jgi:hypothetical protein